MISERYEARSVVQAQRRFAACDVLRQLGRLDNLRSHGGDSLDRAGDILDVREMAKSRNSRGGEKRTHVILFAQLEANADDSADHRGVEMGSDCETSLQPSHRPAGNDSFRIGRWCDED